MFKTLQKGFQLNLVLGYMVGKEDDSLKEYNTSNVMVSDIENSYYRCFDSLSKKFIDSFTKLLKTNILISYITDIDFIWDACQVTYTSQSTNMNILGMKTHPFDPITLTDEFILRVPRNVLFLHRLSQTGKLISQIKEADSYKLNQYKKP